MNKQMKKLNIEIEVKGKSYSVVEIGKVNLYFSVDQVKEFVKNNDMRDSTTVYIKKIDDCLYMSHSISSIGSKEKDFKVKEERV